MTREQIELADGNGGLAMIGLYTWLVVVVGWLIYRPFALMQKCWPGEAWPTVAKLCLRLAGLLVFSGLSAALIAACFAVGFAAAMIGEWLS